MARNKGETNGEGNDESNSADNGRARKNGLVGLLEFDDFVDAVRPIVGQLAPLCWVSAPDAEGRTMGSRLGKLPLEPLDTLDDRVADEWRGPRVVVLRTKNTNGTWALCGRLDVPAKERPQVPATSHDAQVGIVLGALVKQLDTLQAEVREMRSGASTAQVERMTREVDGLEKLARVFTQIMPTPAQTQAAAPGASPAAQLREMLDIVKTLPAGAPADASGIALKAIEHFGPAAADLMGAVAGLLRDRAKARPHE